MDIPKMLASAGLKNFSGSISLVFDVQGNSAGLLMAGGSVDQKYTYVFGVVPKGVKVSAAKNLSYWSISDGDDTMVTLWNAADEAQDLIFQLMFTGGHYDFPIHLGARVTASGMTPMEQLTQNGTIKLNYKTFATPSTTAAGGLFDDIPVATCFSTIPPVGSDVCVAVTQNFEVVYNAVTYPITTTVTQLQCYRGVRVSSTGNPTTPTNKNFSYTLGNP